jgi:hypothetical protein
VPVRSTSGSEAVLDDAPCRRSDTDGGGTNGSRRRRAAAWIGHGYAATPRHVYELSIDGGGYNGARLRASTEAGLMRAFDATVDAIKAHRPPYWLDEQAVST